MPFISTIPGHNTYKSECEKMQINPKAPLWQYQISRLKVTIMK